MYLAGQQKQKYKNLYQLDQTTTFCKYHSHHGVQDIISLTKS